MVDYGNLLQFYKGKRVFITGNTGFKGSWISYILLTAGAQVQGYSLEPPTDPSLFRIIDLESFSNLKQEYADIREQNTLLKCVENFQPELIVHMAAQPIVRESYRDPVTTYSTNIMGTVNVCEAIRRTNTVKSFLNVTTDKVYRNHEWVYGYRECDELGGFDPYSNSKSCSELVTYSYKDSFLSEKEIGISTVRAGNVIGGGDFSIDRIIPDCVRALSEHRVISVRNPHSIRPYQHVLDPLFAYLLILKCQYENRALAGCYNVGPDDNSCVHTGDLVRQFCDTWNSFIECNDNSACSLSWENQTEENAVHEADILKLDCSKLKVTFGWQPRWNIEDAVKQTVKWTQIWMQGANKDAVRKEMNREIKDYLSYDP